MLKIITDFIELNLLVRKVFYWALKLATSIAILGSEQSISNI